MAGTAVILLGVFCLHAGVAHAARPQTDGSAKATRALKNSEVPRRTATATTEQSTGTQSLDADFTSSDLASLGNSQPIILRGTQSRYSVRFVLPNSEVVTGATLNMRYRLSLQLNDQASRLNLLINGIGAASVALLHSADDSTDQQISISIPAELLLTENTLEFQLAGVCAGGNCGSPNVMTVVQPTSVLDLVGRRLALASDLSRRLRRFSIRAVTRPLLRSLFWLLLIQKR